jgi:hypothetical protein
LVEASWPAEDYNHVVTEKSPRQHLRNGHGNDTSNFIFPLAGIFNKIVTTYISKLSEKAAAEKELN